MNFSSLLLIYLITCIRLRTWPDTTLVWLESAEQEGLEVVEVLTGAEQEGLEVVEVLTGAESELELRVYMCYYRKFIMKYVIE